jgi:hypothetical protein
MNRICNALLASVLACGATLASAAPATQVPINNASAAARAAYLTLTLQSQVVQLPLEELLGYARKVAADTLGFLNDATTPTAAMRGVTIPCPVSGSLTAKLARIGPRVLDVTWNDCKSPFGQSWTYNGHGELVLSSASFTPDALLLLHLGTRDQDFVQSIGDDPTFQVDFLINLRALGRIPIKHAGDYFYTGPFIFTLDGVIDQRYTSSGSDPALPPSITHVFHTAENMLFYGATTIRSTQPVLDDDVTIATGTFENRFEVTGYPAFAPTGFTAHNLRVRQLYFTDGNGYSSVAFDGDVDYRWDRPTSGCADGRYRFRTIEPIRRNFELPYEAHDQGRIFVNDAAISYSLVEGPGAPDWYTPAPGEKPTHVGVAMSNGEHFDHMSFFPGSTLYPLTFCPN